MTSPAQQSPRAIYAAIWGVMKDVTSVPKTGQYAQGNTRYKFRSFDDTMVALGDSFRKHGVFVQSAILDTSMDLTSKKTSNGGVMTVVTLRVRFIFTSLVDGSELVFEAMGESADTSDKATNKAHTMAMKTALTQAFALPTGEKDPDAERPGDEPVQNQQARQQQRPQNQRPANSAPPVNQDGQAAEKREAAAQWYIQQMQAPDITLERLNSMIGTAKERSLLGYQVNGAALKVHFAAAGATLGQAAPEGGY
jgi:hypothetical protein